MNWFPSSDLFFVGNYATHHVSCYASCQAYSYTSFHLSHVVSYQKSYLSSYQLSYRFLYRLHHYVSYQTLSSSSEPVPLVHPWPTNERNQKRTNGMTERILERIHDMICNMLQKRMHVGVITWMHDGRIKWIRKVCGYI